MPTCLEKYAKEYDELLEGSIIPKFIAFVIIVAAVCGAVMGSIELSYTNRSYPLGMGLLIPGGVVLLLMLIGWCTRRMHTGVSPSPQRQPAAFPDLENQMHGTKTPVKPVALTPLVSGARKVVVLDEHEIQSNPMHQEDLAPSPTSQRRRRSISSDSENPPKKEKKDKKEKKELHRSSSESDITLKKQMQENPIL